MISLLERLRAIKVSVISGKHLGSYSDSQQDKQSNWNYAKNITGVHSHNLCVQKAVELGHVLLCSP